LNAVAWFIGQSIVVIAAAFLLGILVGWLIWGRTWRLKRTSVSGAQAQAPIAAAATSVAATSVAAEPVEDKAPTPEPKPVLAEAEPEPVLAEAEPGPGAAETERERVAAEAEPVPVLVGAETTAAPPLEPVAVQPLAAVATLEPVAPVQPVQPDHLERIEGIGPKMAAALHEAGIKTYEQLADADVAALRRAIESHGMRFAPSIATWGRQARLLADGDEEGFADLTRRLVAGRDEGRQ
jgi:predicted flap endonuclease-1-like 5' DNA nuclease